MGQPATRNWWTRGTGGYAAQRGGIPTVRAWMWDNK